MAKSSWLYVIRLFVRKQAQESVTYVVISYMLLTNIMNICSNGLGARTYVLVLATKKGRSIKQGVESS